MYRLEHRDLRRLADDLTAIAARRGFDLTPRPWNRFEPDDTDWWLVPGSEWPAHRYGKLFLHWLERRRSRAEAALHLEKGLGPEVSPAYDAPRGRRRIMDEDWAWHGLLESLDDGRFERALSAVQANALGTTILRIEGGYVPDPDSFDPYAYDFERDVFTFEPLGDSGKVEPASSEAPAGLLDPLGSVGSVSDLGRALSELSADPWLWMDFTVGVELRLNVAPTAETPPMSPLKLWSHLERFRPWLQIGQTSG